MVTWENYEEYIMLELDGELDDADRKELSEFIRQHPELAGEKVKYGMARLNADAAEIYPWKETLLKPVTVGIRPLHLGPWVLRAAAGIAAIILIASLVWKHGTKEHILVNVKPSVSKNVSAVQMKAPSVQPRAIVQVQTPGEQPKLKPIKRHLSRQKALIDPDVVPPKREFVPVAALPSAKLQPLPTATEMPQLALVPQPEVKEVAKMQETNKSILDLLPIGPEKKQGIENVANAINNGVNALTQQINTSGLSVKIHNKQLILTF